MKKYTFKVDGNEIKFEEKSYAAVFRSFFAHFMNENLDKTVETIDKVGIRTSDDSLFIAKNGAKKKNIELVENERWIYTHLTPKAMEKAYEKFVAGWTGEWDKMQEEKRKQEEEAQKAKEEKKAEKERKRKEKEEAKQKKKEEKEAQKAEEVKEEPQEPEREKDEVEKAKDAIAQEEYGVNFEDLVPTQKTKVTKTYNKAQKEKEVKK